MGGGAVRLDQPTALQRRPLYFTSDPIDRMKTTLELAPPSRGSGTRLTYEVQATPRSLLGRAASRWRSGRRAGGASPPCSAPTTRPPADRRHSGEARPSRRRRRARLGSARKALVETRARPETVDRLCRLVEEGDDLSVARSGPTRSPGPGASIGARPSSCASRARAPGCSSSAGSSCARSAGERPRPAKRWAIPPGRSHCDTCLIDFTAEFDRSVEVTFRPSPAIREVAAVDFCVAGPQVTPHIVAQQLLAAGEGCSLSLRLDPGSYRLRALGLPGALPVTVGPGGQTGAAVRPAPEGWPAGTLELAEEATLEAREREPGGSCWPCSSAPRGATRPRPPPR